MRLRTQGRLWQTERAQVARDDFVAGAAVYDAGPRMYLLSPRRVYESSVQAGLAPEKADRFPPHTAGFRVPTKFSPPGRGTRRGWQDLGVPTFICANKTYICEIFLERK